MVSIRPARVDDIYGMQDCNLHCLPENYQAKYWMLHLVTYPGVSMLAEDADGKIVGYVLAKV